jgi:phosphoenolpyruvate carboxylase
MIWGMGWWELYMSSQQPMGLGNDGSGNPKATNDIDKKTHCIECEVLYEAYIEHARDELHEIALICSEAKSLRKEGKLYTQKSAKML